MRRNRSPAVLQNTVRGSRFTQNFKKGFVSQEYRSLLRRTEAPVGGLPEAICLVAVSPDGRVAGTLDLRPPACAADRQPKGVPKVCCCCSWACDKGFNSC